MQIELNERQTGIWNRGAFFRTVVLQDARVKSHEAGEPVAVIDCHGQHLQTVQPEDAGTYER